MERVKTMKRVPGTMCKERLIIKSVANAHEFLNKQYDNVWSVYDGPLKAGTYAFAGGQWHNVKHLDASVLAHI